MNSRICIGPIGAPSEARWSFRRSTSVNHLVPGFGTPSYPLQLAVTASVAHQVLIRVGCNLPPCIALLETHNPLYLSHLLFASPRLAAPRLASRPHMDRDLQHMLSAAVLAGSANVVQQLLEQGADVNLGDLLHMAASANDVAVATTLIRNGAYLNMPGRLYDDTPLLAACRRGHMEAARVLLDAHADVDAADSGGTTSLHLAAKLRHVGLAIMLIRTYGADKSATNVRHAVVTPTRSSAD